MNDHAAAPASRCRREDGNPSLLPDAVYFALEHMAKPMRPALLTPPPALEPAALASIPTASAEIGS